DRRTVRSPSRPPERIKKIPDPRGTPRSPPKNAVTSPCGQTAGKPWKEFPRPILIRPKEKGLTATAVVAMVTRCMTVSQRQPQAAARYQKPREERRRLPLRQRESETALKWWKS